MNSKEIIRKLNVMIIVILLLCGFAIGQIEGFQVVPQEQVPEVLNTISSRVHQNFLQIRSLEGEIQVTWYEVYKGENAKRILESRANATGKAPDKIAEVTQSVTKFSCDLDKGFFYSENHRSTPVLYIDPASGKDVGTGAGSWWTISILTPEYYLHSSPNRMRDGHVLQRRGVKEKVELDCSSCKDKRPPSVFDPRDLFDARTPVWLYYPRIVERMKEEGEYIVDDKYTLKVEQLELDGETQYRVHEPAKVGPEGANVWLIKTYSSNVGYNMISSERIQADEGLLRRQSTEYQSVQGVYMPKKITREIYDPNDGDLLYRKQQTFKNVRLNAVIPPDRFTYKALGLKNGDEFQDNILSKKYVYQDNMLAEAEVNEK